jgi:hypothetical protein
MPFTTIYGGSPSTRVIGDGTAIEQALHPTVMNYIAEMRSPTGGNYAMSVNEIEAVNNMVQAMVANGIWSKMRAVYPVIGGTAAAHKYNLVDPRDADAAFRLSFLGGGWTHNSNGMTPNGTTSYANTFLNPSTTLTLNNTHLAYYTSTSTVANNQRDIAVFINGENPVLSIGTNTNLVVSDSYNAPANRLTATMNNGSGLVSGSRTSSTSHKAFLNGIQLGNTDTASTSGQSLPNAPLYIGCANITGAGSGTSAFSNKNYRFISIGDGLTDAEARAFYQIVQTFQTKLGRQV